MAINSKDLDKDMFDEIWACHHQYLEKYCAYKLKDHPDRQADCVQDAFIALFQRLSSGENIQNPKAWLTATVNNIIKTHYRQIDQERKIYIARMDKGLSISVEYDYVEEMIPDHTIQQFADQILDKLSENEREILERVYAGTDKKKKIAAEMGISENALYQLLFRLKHRVRKLARELLHNA